MVTKDTRHTAELHIQLRTAGEVTLRISNAPTKELLEWLEPILVYLREGAAEELAAGEQEHKADDGSGAL